MNNLVKIKVIGVGGAGNNAVERMINDNVQGVEFIIINTDEQVINQIDAPNKIIIGKELTKGMGAGADPEIGKLAAEESKEEIREKIEGSDLVFITAGLGGGTGTGAAPVIAKIAKELGILTIATVNKPFLFEGKTRQKNAEKGLEELKKFSDTVLVVPNEKLFEIIDKDTSQIDAFKHADNLLKHSIQSIADLVIFPGIINLDFADVKKILKDSGTALFGVAKGEGDEASINAAKAAINHPILEIGLEGATKAIVNITGGPSLTMYAVRDAMEEIKKSTTTDLDIIYGTHIRENLEDNVIVSIIATGYNNEAARKSMITKDSPKSVALGGSDDLLFNLNKKEDTNIEDLEKNNNETENNKFDELMKETDSINISEVSEEKIDDTFDEIDIPDYFNSNNKDK